ncbi:dTMP kinase [Bacillus cytotoxicus]|uniref:Thymidylate kinase n=2 Tax=Bacillus cytotoxicus TaxID=580165 RepID=KTHY_BACCN|nr:MULTISPECIES: dTMP kinase [Bacillus cereus group]A7GJU2.1 RecName: Full=Thymidylate kinase; AltName: Full=dTMP kinase [Bacillus cytotoxicus NVH 391-98]ABS20400.1 dTMP kinase [Bacillus cytotoxicus NVH 391-98]AWC31074.1 thymidylate kinase [Bacillus cytotoxicus]AWC35117.1 thymidylate kinase [Bacillus cytotoxicus]AWC43149.1 thymidylate kinase [Bacillus cytotoxicus]AWC59339.1 thymidylate kinase [Bacillus cytotoxicus]
MKGLFVTIEGPEGSGKSTLITKLLPYFENKGQKVIATREPGGIAISEEIRTILHKKEYTTMEARTEALLYAAARRQHLVEKVMPALEADQLVLCDRFIDSSLAYQGYARGLGIDKVYEMNRFATEDCMPSLTIYLDIAPEVGLARIEKDAAREVNRLDMESIAFHRLVREGYLQIVERFKDRIVVVNADQPMENVVEEVIQLIESKLL